jgi:nucleotide-binding universal stress UspA family protein
MSRILVAVDNSATARGALEVGSWLAELLDLDVDAVHVREDGSRSIDAEATAAGVPLRVVSGHPADVLRAEVAADEVVFAVIGSRARPGGPHPAGHMAFWLMQHATKPLVVVPPGSRRPEPTRPLRLLVALDGRDETATAMGATIEVFGSAGLEIVAVHVFEPSTVPRMWDQPHHAAQTWGAEFARRFCPEIPVHVCVGVPVDRVLDVARSENVSMIALGWSQDLSVGHSEVVRGALASCPVPVLLVPLPDPVIDLNQATEVSERGMVRG